MKKSLLLIAALALGFVGAKAEDVSFVITNIDPALVNADEYLETTYKEDGTVNAYAHWNGLRWVGNDQFMFTFSYTDDIKNYPCLYTTKEGGKWSIRIYNGADMTFTSNTPFKQLTFVIADSKKCVPEPSVGTCAESGSNVVWTAPEGTTATSVTFTYTAQMRFSEFIMSTEGGDPEPPEPVATNGVYGEATAIAAGSYVIYAQNSIATPLGETKSYGYLNVTAAQVSNKEIVAAKANAFEFVAVDGGWNIKDSFGRYLYQSGTYNSFNVSSEKLADVGEAAYLWTVEVVDGKFVITNSDVEKSIQYDTNYGSYGSYPDVRGEYPVLYKYLRDAGDEPIIEKTSVTALSQLSSLANKEEFKMDCDLTVAYANGAYNYVYDGANYGLIYKSGLGLEAGKVVKSGWEGTISIYNNLIEMIPDAEVTAEDGGTVPAPYEVQDDEAETALTAANQNVYVKLLGVEFADATPAEDAGKTEEGVDLRSFTGKFGDTEVAFYQRFGVPSVPAGKYNVTGFISVFKEQIQVLPTAYEEVAGIEGIDVDNTPARYYDIQGIEVANPRQGGLYIRVQGGVASKVKF